MVDGSHKPYHMILIFKANNYFLLQDREIWKL